MGAQPSAGEELLQIEEGYQVQCQYKVRHLTDVVARSTQLASCVDSGSTNTQQVAFDTARVHHTAGSGGWPKVNHQQVYEQKLLKQTWTFQI